jgi:hypothetical protein
MPSGEGQERERFAAAVEGGLGAVPPGDEDAAELRRELELVALLRESRASLAPSADASARMRARVMAGASALMSSPASASDVEPDRMVDTVPNADAPTLVDNPLPAVAEVADPTFGNELASDHTTVVPIGRARGRHRFPRQRPDGASGQRRSSLLGISAAAAMVVLAVTGGGAVFSQDALPGDSLYGVKQTTESALVGLTPGQGNKAQRQLDYAATRINEVQQLNSEPDSSSKGADISQALKGFDSQTQSGSQMWLSGSGSDNKAQLGTLADWAQTQSKKLSALRSTMPADAQPDADHSLRLLEDLRTRAQSLSNREGCDKVTSGESDALGPLPAKGACTLKDAASQPSTKSLLPGVPGRSDSSNGSSRDSDSSSSSEHSDHSQRSKDSDRSKDSGVAPGLPGIPGLTGGSDGQGGVLPGKEPTKGDGVLPTPDGQHLLPTPDQKDKKPGLNLPLLPLPIVFHPSSSGLPGKSNG